MININVESYLNSTDGVRIVFMHTTDAFTLSNPCVASLISPTGFTCNRISATEFHFTATGNPINAGGRFTAVINAINAMATNTALGTLNV